MTLCKGGKKPPPLQGLFPFQFSSLEYNGTKYKNIKLINTTETPERLLLEGNRVFEKHHSTAGRPWRTDHFWVGPGLPLFVTEMQDSLQSRAWLGNSRGKFQFFESYVKNNGKCNDSVITAAMLRCREHRPLGIYPLQSSKFSLFY